MPSVLSDIISKINENTFSFPLVAQQIFDQSTPTFPRVIVFEIRNQPHILTSADTKAECEAVTSVGYQIEIYAKDAIKDGTAYDRVSVCQTLREELGSFIWEEIGLIRGTLEPPITPDGDTVRGIIRVNGLLDRSGYIYTQ